MAPTPGNLPPAPQTDQRPAPSWRIHANTLHSSINSPGTTWLDRVENGVPFPGGNQPPLGPVDIGMQYNNDQNLATKSGVVTVGR